MLVYWRVNAVYVTE